MLKFNKIYHGDCLKVMKSIEDKSIDMILCDLPYGVTACKWDKIISLKLLWKQYNRVIKDNGVIVLFSQQLFTTQLIMSNINCFKYCWYWLKNKGADYLQIKNKPVSIIEEICIFSKAPMGHKSLLGVKRMRYNPQGVIPGIEKKVNPHGENRGARPNQVGKKYKSFSNFPKNVLKFNGVTGKELVHPTQKPVALFEYLIKTYTNENDIILDNYAGAGTTGIACLNTNRNYILIEKEEKYCEIAKKKIKVLGKKNINWNYKFSKMKEKK